MTGPKFFFCLFFLLYVVHTAAQDSTRRNLISFGLGSNGSLLYDKNLAINNAAYVQGDAGFIRRLGKASGVGVSGALMLAFPENAEHYFRLHSYQVYADASYYYFHSFNPRFSLVGSLGPLYTQRNAKPSDLQVLRERGYGFILRVAPVMQVNSRLGLSVTSVWRFTAVEARYIPLIQDLPVSTGSYKQVEFLVGLNGYIYLNP